MKENIILASASPRRIEMFHERGLFPRVIPADIEECLPFAMLPQTAVMYLSLAKALHVAKEHAGLIIAADTVVVFEGEIMGKPADEEEAFRVLSRLRGKTHQVITGVCLIDSRKDAQTPTANPGAPGDEAPADRPQSSELKGGTGGRGTENDRIKGGTGEYRPQSSGLKRCLYDVTDVTFGTYTDEELRAYVRTPEPYDKAGGYAIQETFGRYIDHINGDLDNVIGFPMYRVEAFLAEKYAGDL